ncbi:hypothetical protein E2C01_051060 [Portunus trituberculatus]|uniref:Uncharacterized protein n=1 Tax=Portunus trituberculatus TaxID=210409 RepID=A0A5B7GHL4_PORTR|nr:hypothetical protein [Portunus trituberculatus]
MLEFSSCEHPSVMSTHRGTAMSQASYAGAARTSVARCGGARRGHVHLAKFYIGNTRQHVHLSGRLQPTQTHLPGGVHHNTYVRTYLARGSGSSKYHFSMGSGLMSLAIAASVSLIRPVSGSTLHCPAIRPPMPPTSLPPSPNLILHTPGELLWLSVEPPAAGRFSNAL